MNTKWINVADTEDKIKRFINTSQIGECYVTQVLPIYGWWVKCDHVSIPKKYWIHGQQYNTKDEALTALDKLIKK